MSTRLTTFVVFVIAGAFSTPSAFAQIGTIGSNLGRSPQQMQPPPRIELKPPSLEPTLKVPETPKLDNSLISNGNQQTSAPPRTEAPPTQVAISVPASTVESTPSSSPSVPSAPATNDSGWFKTWGGWIALGIVCFFWITRRTDNR